MGNDIEKFVVVLKRLTEDLNIQSYFRGDGRLSSYLEKNNKSSLIKNVKTTFSFTTVTASEINIKRLFGTKIYIRSSAIGRFSLITIP
ncbi:hypothetical protein [Psychrobacillus sp. OK032]|uniref:hypothetical protein n=1 Tax=Psychrobacillus sp. OK032 TaxID=1884358 RepID=UPI001160BCC8|nr:hypothetical protein [Psychrobacillus sp. OK032]